MTRDTTRFARCQVHDHCDGNCRDASAWQRSWPRWAVAPATRRPCSAQALAAPIGQPGAPIVVSCEPNQRTLVRPVVVNGATVSQVECITNGAAADRDASRSLPRWRIRTVIARASATRCTTAAIDLARCAHDPPVSQPTTVARPIQARQVVYTMTGRCARRAR